VKWGVDDIPDLSGKRALVTGVTSGIGETTVLELARHGAEVILGARNPAKLEATIARIQREVPGANLHPLSIDVSDLASVRRAAAQVDQPLDLLVNNAGVMATPHQRTADGLELQMATNYFGPFALTGLLFPRLVDSGDGRVVAISSQGSRMARRAPLDDPFDQSRRYGRWQAYFASKLADLMFIFELDRRCREQRVPVKGLAAHPGYSSTGLMGTGRNTGNTRERLRWSATILQAAFQVAGQPPELGALPTLMAATADLPGSTYVGPEGLLQFKGHPRIVNARALAHDREAQRRLWEISEEATGVQFLDG
jgi:NAD(P)-dependent dehydrogenase (short-subunit alcohol dehydrogenase family)